MKSSGRTREQVALCMGRIMLSVSIISKWSLWQCYSQMPQVILRRRSYASTTPSPCAVQLPQPSPWQNKGKLAAAVKGNSLRHRVAYSMTREGQGKWWLKGRSVHRLTQWRGQARNNQWRRLVQYSLVKTIANLWIRDNTLFETQPYPSHYRPLHSLRN